MTQPNDKFLAKFRNLASTGVSFKSLAEHLPALGFGVEATKVWAQTGLDTRPGRKSDLYKQLSVLVRIRSSYTDGTNQMVTGWNRFDEISSIERAREIAVKAREIALGQLQSELGEPKLNRWAVTAVGDLEENTRCKHGTDEPAVYTATFAVTTVRGVKAYVLTAPDGASETFQSKAYMSKVLAWLGEHGLVEAASDALGVPTPAAEKVEREMKARDWTNTGTCPCCERNVKLRDGHMVLHGYERPGTGEAIGQCFGVGYEPYERSTSGCEAYQAAQERQVERLSARLAKISADDFDAPYSIQKTERVNGQRVVSVVEITKGDAARWDRAHRLDIAQTERDLRQAQFEVDRMISLIGDWRPGLQMPEEIARERGWL